MGSRSRSGVAGVVVVGLVSLVVAGCGGEGGNEVVSSATSDPDAVVRSSDTTAGVPGEPKGPGVVGRVTCAGRPVEGVLLSPRSLDTPPQAVIEIAILTDRDGRYLWRLGLGAWEMTASAEGFRPATLRVEIRDQALSILDFGLERA